MKIDLKINSTEEQRICDEMRIYIGILLLERFIIMRNLMTHRKAKLMNLLEKE